MLIKTLISGEISAGEEKDVTRPVVRVAAGGGIRFGFEMERDDETGEVIVYLPGTPDPGTGIVMSVSSDCCLQEQPACD